MTTTTTTTTQQPNCCSLNRSLIADQCHFKCAQSIQNLRFDKGSPITLVDFQHSGDNNNNNNNNTNDYSYLSILAITAGGATCYTSINKMINNAVEKPPVVGSKDNKARKKNGKSKLFVSVVSLLSDLWSYFSNNFVFFPFSVEKVKECLTNKTLFYLKYSFSITSRHLSILFRLLQDICNTFIPNIWVMKTILLIPSWSEG